MADVPENVTATPVSDTEVDVTCDIGGDWDYLQIQRVEGVEIDDSALVIAENVTEEDLPYRDSNLTPSTNYIYRMRSVDDTDTS